VAGSLLIAGAVARARETMTFFVAGFLLANAAEIKLS